MSFLEQEKPEKKEMWNIWIKPSVRKRFNIICAQEDLNQGEGLEFLCNLYEHKEDRYQVAGLPRR